MKKCAICGIAQTSENSYTRTKGGLYSYCKGCWLKRSSEYRRTNWRDKLYAPDPFKEEL